MRQRKQRLNMVNEVLAYEANKGRKNRSREGRGGCLNGKDTKYGRQRGNMAN